MISVAKTKSIKEYGDFQTPKSLASDVCLLVKKRIDLPRSIVEPTCGIGGFIQAASEVFPFAAISGFEISSEYAEVARARFKENEQIAISQADFFESDWATLFQTLQKPILVLGNPPWVTNSQLSTLESNNLPKKSNVQGLSGLDAMTGKSNFDISEWMLIQLLNNLDRKHAYLAMLCKTSVARKVLRYAWKTGIRISNSAIYRIETEKYFNASVDSCLFFCDFSPSKATKRCSIFQNLSDQSRVQEIGYGNGEMIASIPKYEKWKYLNGGSDLKWRSGIKHDCSKVIEFTPQLFGYENGRGEIVELEDKYLYPMLKSSDLASGNVSPRRWMLVTQKYIGDDTTTISEEAPMTWEYLNSNSQLLDKRGSSIYKQQSRFAMFGIGDYSFAPWKVAISGFYKHLTFNVVGNYEGKPIVLDDTCYFLPFDSKEEAERICSLLNSDIAQEFYQSFVFWDAKRPISADILQKLNIRKLENFFGDIEELGEAEAYDKLVASSETDTFCSYVQDSLQLD